ncbi:MAG: PIN domain-containing protein [Tepidisphaeraceae bacterium]
MSRACFIRESGDAWIASTAIRHDIELITHDRDVAQVEPPGLRIVCYAQP